MFKEMFNTIERVRYDNPIVLKHMNIWLFDSFGFAFEFMPDWKIIITFGFVSIHLYLGGN